MSLELSVMGFPFGCSGGVVYYTGAWLPGGMLGPVRSGSGLDLFCSCCQGALVGWRALTLWTYLQVVSLLTLSYVIAFARFVVTVLSELEQVANAFRRVAFFSAKSYNTKKYCVCVRVVLYV